VLNLAAGETLEPFKKSSPNLVFPAFFNSIAEFVSASESMPLSVVKMLFGESYSASRGELQLFWLVVAYWRLEIAYDFLFPLYLLWLENEIARGNIICNGYSDSKLKQAWTRTAWIGSPIPQLDPNKQAEADKTYIELGATTLKRIAKDYNGSDAANNRAQLRRELSNLPGVPWGKTNNQTAQGNQ
jgi:capsid protein